MIIDVLVYYGYIKNIFGSDEDNDSGGLSVKLQVKRLHIFLKQQHDLFTINFFFFWCVSLQFQDFLICIEMFIAALAHKYSFPHEPYHINIPDYGNDRTWFNSLSQMWDMSDVRHDVSEHLGVVGSSLSRRLRGRTAYHLTRGTETDHLMSSNLNLGATSSCYQVGFNSASDSDVSTIGNKNHYGALHSSDDRMTSNDDIVPVHMKHDGINIVKQNQKSKDYSPQYGVPKVLGNYFAQQTRSTQLTNNAMQSSATSSKYERSNSDNTTSKSESGFDLLAFDKTENEEPSNAGGTMKKSDSTASDWVSTPTDDFMGIDLKSIEKDRTNFKRDPKI